MQAADVVVVGAGAAGLAAAGALLRRGIAPLVLEQSNSVGSSWASRYERLHLHTVRRFSGLPYHAIPRRYPRYLSKDDYAAYLAEYADALGISVALDEAVNAVDRPNGLWRLETSKRTIASRVVVLATGHYATPAVPPWPGRETFGGRLLHSAEYRTGRDFASLRALVVGLGNSGAEIAADLVEQGATSVMVAMRSTPPIVKRELMGVVPVQLLGITLSPLGIPRAVDRVGASLRKLTVGDLSRYGLGEAAWGPFSARRPAVIDVGFLDQLKAGAVEIKPALDHLTQTAAVFADGSSEEVDVVVAATGFETGLERLLRVPDLLDDGGQPRFGSAEPTSQPGLWFIGFSETVRGHLFEANKAARRLARRIDHELREADRLTSPRPGTSTV